MVGSLQTAPKIRWYCKGHCDDPGDQMAVWHHEQNHTAATYYVEGEELPEGVSVGDEKTPAIDAYNEGDEQLNCMAVTVRSRVTQTWLASL